MQMRPTKLNQEVCLWFLPMIPQVQMMNIKTRKKNLSQPGSLYRVILTCIFHKNLIRLEKAW